MSTEYLATEVAGGIKQLAGVLHGRLAWRLLPLMTGMLFAQGRRTVSSWLRAGQLGHDYQAYYYFLGSLGRKVKTVAGLLVRQVAQQVVQEMAPGERILLALDDTPTKRYGPCVEGAGIHHNPTPGPAGQKFLYGHVWVTLAWVVRHPWWGTIGLPLLALLYVRQADLPWLTICYKVRFQTKLQLAAELLAWAKAWLAFLGKTLWVVVDGAYAKRPFLKAAKAQDLIVVSRLRKDAALRSVPKNLPPGRRGPGKPRIYGKEVISLAKRAGHRQGWQTDAFLLYGAVVRKTYKTFLATYQPAGGLIRVVLVKADPWVAYFCTQPEASVAQILEAVADRAAIEQDFHDLKEVHGAGQVQLRNYWANSAAYHLALWWHTLIELWAWHKPMALLVDRSACPWDDPLRRPSHADRRNALRRQSLLEQYQREETDRTLTPKFRRLWNTVVKLVA
jgi:hypothetical protein